MLLVEQFTAMANVEVAHLALYAARMGAPSATDASAVSKVVEKRMAPVGQALRGEGPQLAASCA